MASLQSSLASISNSSSFNTAGLTSLSLHKFSYATTVNVHGKLLWTHIPQRDNLSVVFDHVNHQDGGGLLIRKRLLRVILGAQTLEEIILEDLQHQARLDNGKIHVLDSSRMVIVIVKRPLLALRYQLPNGQIRRLQMNFFPESDYDVALNALAGLGLPIREKAVLPQPSQYINMASGSSQNVPQHLSQSVPSASAPTTTGSYSQNYRQLQQVPMNSFSSTTPAFEGFRPVSSSSTSTLVPGPMLFGMEHQPRIHTSDGRLENHGPYENKHGVNTTLSSTANDLQQSTGVSDLQVSFETNDTNTRPWTAPTSVINTPADTLSQMLPPKRELPFTRPAPKAIQPKVTSEEASIDPPTGDKGTGNGKVARKRKAPAKPKATVSKAAQNKKSRLTVLAGHSVSPKKGNDTTVPASNGMKVLTSVTVKPNAPVLMDASNTSEIGDATNTNTSSMQPCSDQHVSAEWVNHVEEFMKQFQQRVNPAPPSTVAPRDPVPLSDLAEYVTIPQDERRAGLNKLLGELVMDDNFRVLCEDVETAWRRTELGF